MRPQPRRKPSRLFFMSPLRCASSMCKLSSSARICLCSTKNWLALLIPTIMSALDARTRCVRIFCLTNCWLLLYPPCSPCQFLLNLNMDHLEFNQWSNRASSGANVGAVVETHMSVKMLAVWPSAWRRPVLVCLSVANSRRTSSKSVSDTSAFSTSSNPTSACNFSATFCPPANKHQHQQHWQTSAHPRPTSLFSFTKVSLLQDYGPVPALGSPHCFHPRLLP